MQLIYGIFVLLALLMTPSAIAGGSDRDVAKIEALFDAGRSMEDVKFAVDRLVDPASDVAAARAEFEDLSASLQAMAAVVSGAHQRLKVLKRFVYEPGLWNGHRPFAYDLSDPQGRKIENKHLARYLQTRRGNCVTMPILLASLGRRIGLKMTLSTAPYHVFVKFTDDDGKVWNLEATSGAGYSRESYYREALPMTDRAIASGAYLKTLSDKETTALIASFLVEHLVRANQPEKVIETATTLLDHAPGLVALWIMRGSAYATLLKRDIVTPFPDPALLPPELRVVADGFLMRNRADFAQAESLGWTEKDGIK